MKKLILVLSFISIFSLSSCTVTKNVIQIPEENSNQVVETTNTNEETEVYAATHYINTKTDGTLHYFIPNSNVDGFDVVEEKVDNIYEISLEDILKREIELSSAIPKETVINSIKVENNIAYVDVNAIFSEDPNTNSSALASLKIYSIVNTLYYNRALEIDSVKFLIDGNETESISILSNIDGFTGYEN